MVVTNRGLHTTSSGNSQQNRLTPDWPDIVTRELPGEAFYLYDPDRRPVVFADLSSAARRGGRLPGRLQRRRHGHVQMTRATLATELTVFVPPHEPVGVYLLTVRNRGRRGPAAAAGPLFPDGAGRPAGARRPAADRVTTRRSTRLFFENPRNGYRTGPAFVAMSRPAERVETRRGRFFGPDRDVAHPRLVEDGRAGRPRRPTTTGRSPALLTTLEIPAHGECTVAVVLGQADDRQQAEAVDPQVPRHGAARASLAADPAVVAEPDGYGADRDQRSGHGSAIWTG